MFIPHPLCYLSLFNFLSRDFRTGTYALFEVCGGGGGREGGGEKGREREERERSRRDRVEKGRERGGGGR